MSDLFKVAGPAGEPGASVLLVHGLGGDHYDTWRCGTGRKLWNEDETFWPLWLRRDCGTLAVYVIGYDAPVSRLRGTAMPLTDQATNILARLLAEPALASGPLIFIGHSLGGLIIKQLLRTAESMARYDARSAELIRRVGKVAFLATPHSGSGLATWGDRLRILVRPSEATAGLVRNDSNLRDLNDWYREWANASGITHLILTERKSTFILGMIVPPDSGDPGLSNVRSRAIGTDHMGICKPAAPTDDIYVFVRDFITHPLEPPKPLPDVVVDKLLAALDARGELGRAAEAGIERRTVLELARHLKPDEVLDFDQAVVELTAAVRIAVEVSKRGSQGSNLGNLVDSVLARVAAKTSTGDIEGAAREADQGFVEWQRAEAERRETSVRSGIALLEAGLGQDILRRDAPAAALRVERIVALEHPEDASARFETMRERQSMFYQRGRDKGVNFDLLIAINIARLAHGTARAAEQRATWLNNLGNALYELGMREGGLARIEEAVAAYRAALTEGVQVSVPLNWAATQNNLGAALSRLGARERGTARFEEAVVAYRAALTQYTRERAPLRWAATHNNLGNTLCLQGAREHGTARLEEAVAAYRAALTVYTQEEVPLQWGMTQNNLGGTLWRLGEHERGTARLEEAVAAHRAALTARSREVVPLDWAATQNSIGVALRALGEREGGTARFEEAIAAHRQALMERTRERVPLDWAQTQNNLGCALHALGEREDGTARLEEAVAAYSAAITERTRDRVPLEWGQTQNNLGGALRVIGERENRIARIEEAVAAHRAALSEITREDVPLQWAAAQNELGCALRTLGEREGGVARLEEAVAAHRAALTERTLERVPLEWAASTGDLGVAYMALAERTGDARMARAALSQIELARTTTREGGHASYAANYAERLAKAKDLVERLGR